MKVLPWFLLALTLLYIGWQCNVKPVPLDKHVIDSVRAAKDSTIALYKDSVAIMRIAIQANDSERTKQAIQKAAIEEKMTNKIAQLTFSLNKYRTAKAGRDTVGQLVNCDEIVQALDSLYAQALLYKLTIDSLTTNSAERRGIDSVGIAFRDRTITELTGQYNAVNHFLSDELKNNADLTAALKRSKRGKWLLVGLAAVLGGIAGHGLK